MASNDQPGAVSRIHPCATMWSTRARRKSGLPSLWACSVAASVVGGVAPAKRAAR
ncbi:MAG: hypothetical protein U0802_11665 [Candidatus Binatia bacterium]